MGVFQRRTRGKKLVTCKNPKKVAKILLFFSPNRIFFKLEIVVAKKIMLLSPDRHKNSQWAKIRKKCNLLKSHIKNFFFVNLIYSCISQKFREISRNFCV